MKRLLLLLFILLSTMLGAQNFDLDKFSDPLKYGWNTPELQKEYRQDLEYRTRLLQLYEDQHQPEWEVAVKSATLPGWGHFACKSYTKGQIFMGIEVVLAGSSWYFYDQAMENYDKYKKASQIDDINKYYNDAQNPYHTSQLLMGLYVMFWGYTIYDSVRETRDYNDQLWHKIEDDNLGKRLELAPNGIQFRF